VGERFPGALLQKNLAEVARPSLGALAFLAFGYVLDAAVIEEGLHLYFTATRAIKMMRGTRCTRVLTNLSHNELLGDSACQNAATRSAA
jgi:hypothetical protein